MNGATTTSIYFTAEFNYAVFSEPELTFTFAICRLSVCRL